MNKRFRPVVLFLILIGLAVFFTAEVRFTFTLISSRFLKQPTADIPPSRELASTVQYEPLYQGSETISIDTAAAGADNDTPSALDGMDLQEIFDFRTAKVAQYSSLNIFPNGYNPRQGNSSRIYTNIAPGAKWISAHPYYIANPYCLIILSCARSVMPINLHCRDVEVIYSDGRIEETLRGETARCFFDLAYEKKAPLPGTLQITMVNAYDGGFYFASIDGVQSQNIRLDTKPGNIVSGIFCQSSYYHMDPKHGKNSITPEDQKGWLSLVQRDTPTKIFVKLWRARPQSPADRADMQYVFSVEP